MKIIPADPVLFFYPNGNIFYESYYQNGERHREDGPAKICYYTNGNVQREEYRINGLLHRVDGPAKIWYDENGKVRDEKYYINGIEYIDIFKWMVAAATFKK